MNTKNYNILLSQLKSAEYSRTIHHVTPENNTPFEAVLLPEYWAHVAAHIKPTDRIEIVPEDGSYFAELYVSDVGKQSVKVVLLRKVELEPAIKTEADDLVEVKWCGPTVKFRVTRKSDKAALKEGFASKEEANDWLKENLKNVA